MAARRPAQVVVGVLALALTAFAVQIVAANRIATRDFGLDVCWLKQGRDVTNLRVLEFATKGRFVPNPLTILNRRFIGIGIEDPGVKSPHFAILAQDAAGV